MDTHTHPYRKVAVKHLLPDIPADHGSQANSLSKSEKQRHLQIV